MSSAHLTRLQAVELQNRVKDALVYPRTASAADINSAFEAALPAIRQGQIEGGFVPLGDLSGGQFIAVFDWDETLLQQWYSSWEFGNFDLADVIYPSATRTHIKFTPGVEQALRRLRAHPLNRGIVFFTAKADGAAWNIWHSWRLSDDSPISSLAMGLFTANHLVMGAHVTSPSKDLRIIEPTLEHVVLVDDNPARVLQPELLRVQPRFLADRCFEASRTHDVATAIFCESLLPAAVDEIVESADAAQRLGITFRQAFYPYSMEGRRGYGPFIEVADQSARRQEIRDQVRGRAPWRARE